MHPLAAYLAFWLVLMPLAIVNGLLREYTFGPLLPELRAHQLSTVTGILIMTAAVWLLASLWRPPSSAQQALIVGFAWLVFTVAFEFLFGRLVAGHSWERLLHDYNLFAGRVWLLFLVWITVLPFAVFQFHERVS